MKLSRISPKVPFVVLLVVLLLVWGGFELNRQGYPWQSFGTILKELD